MLEGELDLDLAKRWARDQPCELHPTREFKEIAQVKVTQKDLGFLDHVNKQLDRCYAGLEVVKAKLQELEDYRTLADAIAETIRGLDTDDDDDE